MDKATEVQATMEKLKERIKDKKYKLTTQRQIILQTFIEEQSRYRISNDLSYIGFIHGVRFGETFRFW